jgi:hypothetical protein
MSPPQLARKSGTYTTSRCISVRATARSVSGLFAAPATTRQSIERASASSISPPAAHGASTSQLAGQDGLRRGGDADPVLVRERRARSASRSQPITCAPPRASLAASADADLAEPDDAHAAPSKSSEPVRGREAAAHRLEDRLGGDGRGSPPPPFDTERPTQKRVKRAMWSMSAVVVPMSSAVM